MKRFLVLFMLLAPALPAFAQDHPIPVLDEHHFVPATAITEPFIRTFVQTTVSLGQTVGAMVPVVDLEDESIIKNVPADILLAGIGFRYQHRVKDWLAVYLSMGTAGRLGTSTPSLVAEGINAALGYHVGWLLRLHESRAFIVSGSLGLGNQNATFVNLLDWVGGAIEGQDIPLVRVRQSLKGTGGLHAAWGISRRFGLMGSLEYQYGESVDGLGGNKWAHDARAGLSYDLKYDLKVPLGLSLVGGNFTNNEGTFTGDGVWFWSTRFALQTREDFSIGITMGNYYIETVQYGNSQHIAQTSIDMRYYY